MTNLVTDEFCVTVSSRYTRDDKEENYDYRSYDGLYETRINPSAVSAHLAKRAVIFFSLARTLIFPLN